MTTKSPAELETEIAALQARLVEVEAKLNAVAKVAKPFVSEPHRPIDYTAGVHIMPASVARELAAAIPDSLARQLRDDALKPNPITGTSPSQLPQDRGGAVQRGSGYRDAVPLSSPPGVPLADRIMDMADAIDKADLARRLGNVKKG